MEGSANSLRLKIYLVKDFLRTFPLVSFCLGVASNFVDSESGLAQSVNVLQTIISDTNQQPLTNDTLKLYIY